MKKAYIDKIIKKIIVMFFGIVIYSAGIYFFTVPAGIIPGGATGIATAINYLTGFPIGALVLLINIPLLILAYFFIGHKFTWYTLFTIIMFTIFNDIIYPLFPVYKGDILIAGIFGGALLGAGIGLIFSTDGSTGGIDIVVLIIQKKFPHLSVGGVMKVIEIIIILCAALVYKSVDAVMYSVVCVFVATFCLESVSYALEEGRLVFVTSEKSEEIRLAIISDVKRGVTMLNGKGGYYQKDTSVMLCAVKKREFYQLKKLVKTIDPDAFIMTAKSADIAGNGFNAL